MSSCPKRWSLQRAPCPCRSPIASSLRARSPPPTSCPRTEGEDMALFDFLNRKRPALDGASDEGVSPVASDLTANEAVRRKQRLLLAGVAGAGLILSSFWIFSGDEKGDKLADDGTSEVNGSTKELVDRNLSQQEWMALSENRFQSTDKQLKSIYGQNRRLEMMTAQVEGLTGTNTAMQAAGPRGMAARKAQHRTQRQADKI